MTAQIPDRVAWDGRDWVLAGYDGVGLFQPGDHGLSPIALSTGCWRGFVCRYGVHDRSFTLDRLDVGLATDAQGPDATGPLIAGRPPTARISTIEWRYDGLDLPIPFSGQLLLADGFIQELYVHMGFHPAWKYRTVARLTLTDGRLDDAHDASDEFARIRASMSRDDLGPRSRERNVVERWIAETFDRTFGASRRRASRTPDEDGR